MPNNQNLRRHVFFEDCAKVHVFGTFEAFSRHMRFPRPLPSP